MRAKTSGTKVAYRACPLSLTVFAILHNRNGGQTMPLFEHISPQQRELMALGVPPATPLAFWSRFFVAVALYAVFVRYSAIFMLSASCL